MHMRFVGSADASPERSGWSAAWRKQAISQRLEPVGLPIFVRKAAGNSRREPAQRAGGQLLQEQQACQSGGGRPDDERVAPADGKGRRTRVEDCVGLSEYPQGSQINRAVLAVAWEFKVRPPRIGGRSLVGSWVRLRIDYTIDRR
jgi:hypothetical protein